MEAGILTRVTKDRTRLCVSMYADDVVIFLRLKRQEVQALSYVLNPFGQVTGLNMNVQTSSVSPFRCEGMDLDDGLVDFPAVWARPSQSNIFPPTFY